MKSGAKLIGSKSPMGTVADAYLIRAKTKEVLGEIRADGTLDRGWKRPAAVFA